MRGEFRSIGGCGRAGSIGAGADDDGGAGGRYGDGGTVCGECGAGEHQFVEGAGDRGGGVWDFGEAGGEWVDAGAGCGWGCAAIGADERYDCAAGREVCGDGDAGGYCEVLWRVDAGGGDCDSECGWMTAGAGARVGDVGAELQRAEL